MRKSVQASACVIAFSILPCHPQILDDVEHVNPAWTLASLRPAAWEVQVAGMDFLPGGRLLVLEHSKPDANRTNVVRANGRLYVVANPSANGEAVKYALVAQDLKEPVGALWVNGKVYIAEKNQLNEYTLDAGFTKAVKTRTVAAIPHDSRGIANFQEYTFGLLYKDGYFYVAGGGAVIRGGRSFDSLPDSLDEPRVGGVLKIKDSDGSMEMLNGGMRASNGIAWGPEGTIWITDNQGSYRPSSQLTQSIPGANYGYPNKPGVFSSKPITPPGVWLVHGDIARSPTYPHLVAKGLYAGQFLVGDISQGGIKRVFVEKVNGAWQGCVFSFTGGLEVGIEKILEDSSGTLYVGGFGRGDAANWGWNGKEWGLQKLIPKPGVTAMEILSIRSRRIGMEIEFTQPVGAEGELASSYSVIAGGMAPETGYGLGSMIGKTTLPIKSVQLSPDRKRVFLDLPGLTAGKVLIIKTAGVKSQAGETVRCPAGWYTLNAISPTDPLPSPTRIGPAAAAGGEGAPRIFTTAQGFEVEIPGAGSHRITLSNLQGKAAYSASGNGARRYAIAQAGRLSGLYILEVKLGGTGYRRALAF